ncbi:hypothetical protein MWY44_003538 [Salmonella enterica]|nr:hypothetical protein [Salmonella enterica]EBK3876705.1 hypothetical protein [Salmonella enterica]EGP6795179.1 hypothetical protein [Salmonella enterica]EIS8541839.1 hypothetical protein [Salmonella enterica]EJB0628794.1 hypothetical protein [Salmonella enterica]
MNLSKQTFVLSVFVSLLQLFLIGAYFTYKQGFAYFWVSSGLAVLILGVGIVNAIFSWNDISRRSV